MFYVRSSANEHVLVLEIINLKTELEIHLRGNKYIDQPWNLLMRREILR